MFNIIVCLLVIEVPFCLLHASVFVLLVSQKLKKNDNYSSPFYTFVICCYLFDLIQFITMEMRSKLQFAGVEVREWLSDPTVISVMYFIASCSAHSQILYHFVIAVHRHLVLKKIHQKTTTDLKAVYTWCLAIALVPLALNAFRLWYGGSVIYMFDLMTIRYSNESVQVAAILIDIVISTACVVPQGVLSVLTYRCYSKVLKQKASMNTTESHEVALFLYNVVLLATLVARLAYNWIVLVALLCDHVTLAVAAQYLFPLVVNFYSLSGSTALLFISTTVRHDYIKHFGLNRVFNIKAMVSRARVSNNSDAVLNVHKSDA